MFFRLNLRRTDLMHQYEPLSLSIIKYTYTNIASHYPMAATADAMHRQQGRQETSTNNTINRRQEDSPCYPGASDSVKPFSDKISTNGN